MLMRILGSWAPRADLSSSAPSVVATIARVGEARIPNLALVGHSAQSRCFALAVSRIVAMVCCLFALARIALATR